MVRASAVTHGPPERCQAVHSGAGYSAGCSTESRSAGSSPNEADAEGRRTDADELLHETLELYRSVEATRYVHECEVLLVASAGRGADCLVEKAEPQPSLDGWIKRAGGGRRGAFPAAVQPRASSQG